MGKTIEVTLLVFIYCNHPVQNIGYILKVSLRVLIVCTTVCGVNYSIEFSPTYFEGDISQVCAQVLDVVNYLMYLFVTKSSCEALLELPLHFAH